MRELHAGVIGYGFMGKTHTHSYKTIPLYYSNLPFTVRLEGICDTTPHVAEEARDMQGYAYATTDPMQIINDPKIDVVSICTPNVFHKDLVLAALQAGHSLPEGGQACVLRQTADRQRRGKPRNFGRAAQLPSPDHPGGAADALLPGGDAGQAAD